MTTIVNPEVLEFCSIQVYVNTIFFSGHPTKNLPLRSDRVMLRELQKTQELQLMLSVNVSATTIRKRRKPKKPKKNWVE